MGHGTRVDWMQSLHKFSWENVGCKGQRGRGWTEMTHERFLKTVVENCSLQCNAVSRL